MEKEKEKREKWNFLILVGILEFSLMTSSAFDIELQRIDARK